MTQKRKEVVAALDEAERIANQINKRNTKNDNGGKQSVGKDRGKGGQTHGVHGGIK
jgi:hypothetical protein